jgi:hypothetical protein
MQKTVPMTEVANATVNGAPDHPRHVKAPEVLIAWPGGGHRQRSGPRLIEPYVEFLSNGPNYQPPYGTFGYHRQWFLLWEEWHT